MRPVRRSDEITRVWSTACRGYRPCRLKTAEGFVEYSAPQVAGREEPYRSAIREHLKGHM